MLEKVIIIGCPGSGKSTFGRKLKDVTLLPLYHLDMIFWNQDKTTVSKEVFLDRLAEIMERQSWIIDGNYSSTMELRMRKCDTVFFLDYPKELCLDGVRKRRGQPRSDMPWTETETDDEFMEFINKYNTETRPDVLALLEKYSKKNIIHFRTREESEEYLLKIKEVKQW